MDHGTPQNPSPRLMAARYAWIIDDDFLAVSQVTGTLAGNATGITGPFTAPAALTARLEAGEGDRFVLLDGDDVTCYAGRMVCADDTPDGFEPLDDFGKPNSGATTIRYRRGAVWETL